MNSQNKTLNDLSGHRKRIKERLLKSNEGDFLDYELLELVLCYANPRKDMKPLAKQLIDNFGSFSATINADPLILEKFTNLGQNTIVLFRLIKEASIRSAKQQVEKKQIISSWNALLGYLRVSMGYSKVEIFRIIYLDKKNMIIQDKVLSSGTIDQVAIYPREILKQAIYYDASAVVLVHNHPSGSKDPSRNDIEITKQIQQALIPIGIILHDHVIITKDGYFSFKSNGLL